MVAAIREPVPWLCGNVFGQGERETGESTGVGRGGVDGGDGGEVRGNDGIGSSWRRAEKQCRVVGLVAAAGVKS